MRLAHQFALIWICNRATNSTGGVTVSVAQIYFKVLLDVYVIMVLQKRMQVVGSAILQRVLTVEDVLKADALVTVSERVQGQIGTLQKRQPLNLPGKRITGMVNGQTNQDVIHL